MIFQPFSKLSFDKLSRSYEEKWNLHVPELVLTSLNTTCVHLVSVWKGWLDPVGAKLTRQV